MKIYDWLQFALYISILTILAYPLGIYFTRVFEKKPILMEKLLGPVERLIYRFSRIDTSEEMDWKTYTIAVLLFNIIGLFFLYFLLRIQHMLPLNAEQFKSLSPDLAFNTAVSFVTNTNWQSYSGEITISNFSQAFGLVVQNFLSAATGIAVMLGLIRGITRHNTRELGNFWVDLVRSTLYILLPLAFILALILVSQGVPQTLQSSVGYTTLEQGSERFLRIGPVASQISIKQLGTNGGGFYNVNSAHPIENPTPLSNFLEMISILLIPAALTFAYGMMVKDTRQGWTIFITMLLIFTAMAALAIWAEGQPNPAMAMLNIDQTAGNMEGKEVRFGTANSALWAVATTSASNGSVNAMHDSLNPLSGLVALWMMQLGEIIFGGVGSGLYGMLAFVIIAVFIAGLMVGRTPEYLGKKIESFEMKMSALVILIPIIIVLVGTAAALALPAGRAAIFNQGAQGFSEVLYAFSSAGNNNGSAFAGLSANNPFYNTMLGLAMLAARYALIVPVLAMAGSLAAKKQIPASAGTLPTNTPLFVIWLITVIIIVGALSFFPALSLGPIIQQILTGTGRLF
jgi:K+-transporting ATPase ATPase A chain